MVQPDEKTLEAIITLSSQKEFDFIMKLLDDSIHSLHFANINSTGEIRLWNQGKLQELINLKR